MSDFDAFAELEQVKSERDAALRKVDKYRKRQAAMVEAAYQAVADALDELRMPAVPAPKADRRTKGEEVAVAVLSDWQLAKTTPTYDTAVCERRVEQYAEKVIELTKIQRADHPVSELRVYLLGDIVEGELIFPGQAHRIDSSLYRQVVVDGPRILASFLRRMLSEFASIRVEGCIGNHGAIGGRSRRDMHPETNADAMLYEVVKQMFADEPRLEWGPNMDREERKWYLLDRIGTKKFFAFHGDQIKGGFAGWPWYGFGKKLLAWKDTFGFDYSLSGHFHTPVRFKVGNATHWGNGSTESDNTYALEMLAAQGDPSQWLLFTHPKRGVTAEYEVHMD